MKSYNRKSYTCMTNKQWNEQLIFNFLKNHNCKLLIKLIWNYEL
jgi:hypothetical protein